MLKKNVKILFILACIFIGSMDILQAQAISVTPTSNGRVGRGSNLNSPSKNYYAIFQSDGNFCIYAKKGNGKRFVWHTGTANNADRCLLKSDGRLVIVDKNNKEIWYSSQQSNPKVGYRMVMQDDGNMCIYTAKTNEFIWCSNTAGK